MRIHLEKLSRLNVASIIVVAQDLPHQNYIQVKGSTMKLNDKEVYFEGIEFQDNSLTVERNDTEASIWLRTPLASSGSLQTGNTGESVDIVQNKDTRLDLVMNRSILNLPKPKVEIGKCYEISCNNCKTQLARLEVERVLPLPSSDWNQLASNWFCCSTRKHVQKGLNTAKLNARKGDLIYGIANFLIGKEIILENAVNMDLDTNLGRCSTCSAELGLFSDESIFLWYYSVHISSSPVPEQINNSAVPEHMNSSPASEYVNSSPVPEHISSSPVSEQINSSPVPEQIISSPVPGLISSSTVPEQINSSIVPEQINSSPVTEHMNSSTVPEHTSSSTVTEHMNSSPVPEHIISSTVPEHISSSPVPEHIISSPVPGLISSSTVPEQINSSIVPEHMNSSPQPEHFYLSPIITSARENLIVILESKLADTNEKMPRIKLSRFGKNKSECLKVWILDKDLTCYNCDHTSTLNPTQQRMIKLAFKLQIDNSNVSQGCQNGANVSRGCQNGANVTQGCPNGNKEHVKVATMAQSEMEIEVSDVMYAEAYAMFLESCQGFPDSCKLLAGMQVAYVPLRG